LLLYNNQVMQRISSCSYAFDLIPWPPRSPPKNSPDLGTLAWNLDFLYEIWKTFISETIPNLNCSSKSTGSLVNQVWSWDQFSPFSSYLRPCSLSSLQSLAQSHYFDPSHRMVADWPGLCGHPVYNNQVYAPSIDETVPSFPENCQYFCQYVNTPPHTINNIFNTTDIDSIIDRVRSANTS